MYNFTQLIGRLTSNPEITTTESGKKVCHITLAVQRSYKNPDGVYDADFLKCTLWDAIADRACSYCHKGDLVAVRGQIRTSNYVDDEGVKKNSYEIIVDKLLFLTTKANNNENTEIA